MAGIGTPSSRRAASARRMRTVARACALAGILILAVATTALCTAASARGDDVASIAAALRSGSVYADPAARPTLSPAQAGSLAREIARRDPGRVKIAVASASVTARAGGVQTLANTLDRRLGSPGTVVVVSGTQLWLVTSYNDTNAAASVVQRAFNANASFVQSLRTSVAGIASVDPDRASPSHAPTGSPTATGSRTATASHTATAPHTTTASQSATVPASTITSPSTSHSSGSGGVSVVPEIAVILVVGAVVLVARRRRAPRRPPPQTPSAGVGYGTGVAGGASVAGGAGVTEGAGVAGLPSWPPSSQASDPITAPAISATPSSSASPAERILQSGLFRSLTSGRAPWYARPSFWTGRFLIWLGVALAIGGAYVWLAFGGLPRGFDKYGRVAVPGQQVVALPAGAVGLDFENDVDNPTSTDSSILPAPSGMRVRVSPVANPAVTVHIDRIPGWLFSSQNDTRGHQPYGRINLPAAGRYLVEAGDDDRPLAARPNPAASPTPTFDSGPAIVVGEKPWTPLGSVALGAVLCALLIIAVFALPYGLTRVVGRSRQGAT